MAKRKPKVKAMDWKAILIVVFQVAEKFVPPPFSYLLPWLLEKLLPLLESMTFAAGVAFAAPAELRDWLINFLQNAASKIPGMILRRVVQALIASMTGPMIDAIWDKLVELGIVTGEPSHTFSPVVYAAAESMPTEADLADAAKADLATAA